MNYDDFTDDEVKALIKSDVALVMLELRERLTPDTWYQVISILEHDYPENIRPDWLTVLLKHRMG